MGLISVYIHTHIQLVATSIAAWPFQMFASVFAFPSSLELNFFTSFFFRFPQSRQLDFSMIIFSEEKHDRGKKRVSSRLFRLKSQYSLGHGDDSVKLRPSFPLLQFL